MFYEQMKMMMMMMMMMMMLLMILSMHFDSMYETPFYVMIII